MKRKILFTFLFIVTLIYTGYTGYNEFYPKNHDLNGSNNLIDLENKIKLDSDHFLISSESESGVDVYNYLKNLVCGVNIRTQIWIIVGIFFSTFLIMVLIGWINIDVDSILADYDEEFGPFKNEILRFRAKMRRLNMDPGWQDQYMWFLICVVVVIIMITVIYFAVVRTRACPIPPRFSF